MNRFGSVLMVILLAALLLAMTNPTKADFEEYFHTALVEEVHREGYGNLVPVAAAVGVDRAVMRTIMANTSRDDYVVASVFIMRSGNDTCSTWVAALNHFWLVSEEQRC